jgi:small-conductance mechanosensitive channel
MRPVGSLSIVLIALCLVPLNAVAGQQRQPGIAAPAATAQVDEEQPEPVPVLLSGEPVIWIMTGVGPYTPQFRADRLTQRLQDTVHDRTVRELTVTVTEQDGSSELRCGPHLLMVITPRDAAALGIPRTVMAQQYSREIEAAMRAERLRYAPGTLIRSAIYGAIATLVFAAAVWAVLRLSRRVRQALATWFVPKSESLRAMKAELLSDSRLGRTIAGTTRAVRAVLILVLFDLYLTYTLGLFPWTRAVSFKLIEYALTPVRVVADSFVGYLPKLLFLIVISAVIYLAIRVVGLFFRQIAVGRLKFTNFPAEWAEPTNQIARVLLVAFGLVVAFPYLPMSDSPAFTGVSVFIGVLVSLSSSSALSNMIAGIVLTYTGAFRIGDVVKFGDSFGTIREKSLLATRIRTIKNENVTIPNSLVLGTAVVNYSRAANTMGVIIHTTVTIGYDAPWRKIHDLLIRAALATRGVLKEPSPFVWQTALNDFYVTYEINAYMDDPVHIGDTYAALHANIQDEFYSAGVEIMSPHYSSIRDGNTIAIPEAQRRPDYEPGSFRVSKAKRHSAV